MPDHKGVDTPSGRVDSYTDRSGNTNCVQGRMDGGHTHSVEAAGHFDITKGDGSKETISQGSKSGSSSGSGGSGSGGGSGK